MDNDELTNWLTLIFSGQRESVAVAKTIRLSDEDMIYLYFLVFIIYKFNETFTNLIAMRFEFVLDGICGNTLVIKRGQKIFTQFIGKDLEFRKHCIFTLNSKVNFKSELARHIVIMFPKKETLKFIGDANISFESLRSNFQSITGENPSYNYYGELMLMGI